MDFKDLRAGRQREDCVLWGTRQEWGEFVSQDLQVGNLHFNVIDFGENLLMNVATQKLIGAADRKECNQCVILHLGAALAWHVRGRKKVVPSRGVVYHYAMVTREHEAHQAHEANLSLKNPQSLAEQLISSHIHDVLHCNHDRDFRGIFFFLYDLLKEQAPLVGVRIFDVGRGCQHHEVTVHVFLDSREEDCNQYLDLVAFRHHIRWAKPSIDVPATKWRDWKTCFQKIITYKCWNWSEHVKRSASDQELISWYACTTCKQRRKIPADPWMYGAVGECTSENEESDPVLWIEPNHRAGMKGIPTLQSVSTKIYPTASLQDRTGVVGEIETEREERFAPPKVFRLGSELEETKTDGRNEERVTAGAINAEYPIREKEWRIQGEVKDEAKEFLALAWGSTFNSETMQQLMDLGDKLVHDCGGEVRDAARHVQEWRLRRGENFEEKIDEVLHLSPDLGEKLKEVHRIGVQPIFRGETPHGERERGLPYARHQSKEIAEKLWKDVSKGRMFMCSAETVGNNPEILSSPSTLVPKRLPDRTLSSDKRLIADMRGVNNYTSKLDYHLMSVPSIQGLAKKVALLKRRFPGKSLVCTKRDIDSAFRRLNLHPDSVVIMNTELKGDEMGLTKDPIIFYLALPFGWNGSPGVFAMASDFIRDVVGGYRSSTPNWESSMAFAIDVFVDDIMIIEPMIGRRPEMVVDSAEWAVQLTLGTDAVSESKKRIEGYWDEKHILLGFLINVNSGTIELPDEKLEGAKALVKLPIYDPGSRIVTLKALQELRGCYTHWEVANNIWLYFARPVDLLLGFGDEMGIWVNCDDLNIWASYWQTIEWLREIAEDNGEWKKLFNGHLDRCLPLNIRLSGNIQLPPVMWLSSDATLNWIGVINWRDKQFICAPVGNLLNPFMTRETGNVHISDVELLALVMGIVVWVSEFNGTALGIADNLNALGWMAQKKARHGASLQMLRSIHKWLVKRGKDFCGLYSRSHHNVSADHLTRLTNEEVARWGMQNGFEWVDPYTINDHWRNFTAEITFGREWKIQEMEQADREKVYWEPGFGAIIDWNPGALDVARLCKDRNLKSWVSTPRHSVMDTWCKSLGVNVWNANESPKEKFFLETGLAKTEFEVLDFQFHCEQTGAENAVLFIPPGVGLPADMRWNWTHQWVIDSCAFGDVLAVEWTVLVYMPKITERQEPQLFQLSKRVLGDAMAEAKCAPELENDLEMRMMDIERTRGMKVLTRNKNKDWELSARSHLECLSLAGLKQNPLPWPKELASDQPISNAKWIGILGGMADWMLSPQEKCPQNIVIDALWRIKPVKLTERLISACFLAEAQDRHAVWLDNVGNPNPQAGREKWKPKEDSFSNIKQMSSKSSWDNFRAGRCSIPSSGNERCGSPQSKLNSMVKPLGGNEKTKFFLDNLASGTKVGYWSAWSQWLDFAKQRNHSCWIDQNEGEQWDSNFLEFLLFHLKIMNRKASTLKTKIAAVRFYHVAHGKMDFMMGNNRAKALIKGVEKRETPGAKRPFNLELLVWMKENKFGEISRREQTTLYSAAVVGFFFLLRVSEIAALRPSDISVEDTPKGKRLIIIIRKSKTDQAGVGITRALIETKGKICPVGTMVDYLQRYPTTGNEPIFGKGLRLRLEGGLKTAAVRNGVNPSFVGTHSLRAGGATALYVNGVSVILIQRFGRWKSASFLRYLWYDAVALEPLSLSLATASGLLEPLKMVDRGQSSDLSKERFRAGGRGENVRSEETDVNGMNGWDTDVEAVLDAADRERERRLYRSPLTPDSTRNGESAFRREGRRREGVERKVASRVEWK